MNGIVRRAALKVLAAAPFAASRVRHTLSNHTPEIGSRVGADLSNRALMDAGASVASAPMHRKDDSERIQRMMTTWVRTRPGYLAELREAIRRDTHVTYIDPDLMAMKSLSMAARIVYMRERQIERAMQGHLRDEDMSVWSITERWMKRARTFLGIDK